VTNVVISARQLRKTYGGARGRVHALRGIDLDVSEGEFFGLLGPNGAGKSTFIGILTTLVRLGEGSARVYGRDVGADPLGVRSHVGVTSQAPNFDRSLTVAENLEFRGRYCGMPGKQARRRAVELLGDFKLADRANAKVHQLSGGQAKRLMIARALIHRPDVLFLDEPTAGVDPQARLDLWDLLRDLRREGLTYLLTTHNLAEAETLCDRIAIMNHGQVLAEGNCEELKLAAGAETVVTATYRGAAPAEVKKLACRAGVSRVEISGQEARVFTRAADGLLSALVQAGARARVPVTDVKTLQPSLESAFLTLAGREHRP
jgi:ABC-type multidrug transport system ATPase subunit